MVCCCCCCMCVNKKGPTFQTLWLVHLPSFAFILLAVKYIYLNFVFPPRDKLFFRIHSHLPLFKLDNSLLGKLKLRILFLSRSWQLNFAYLNLKFVFIIMSFCENILFWKSRLFKWNSLKNSYFCFQHFYFVFYSISIIVQSMLPRQSMHAIYWEYNW